MKRKSKLLTSSSKQPSKLRQKSRDSSPDVVFIPKEPTPDAGNIEYVNDCLHPNTLQFLHDLKHHNDREWFWTNEKRYRTAKADFESLVDSLTTRLIQIDTTVPYLPHRDIIFRIFRDVRFSNDQTPYKAHFSAAWSRTGRKGAYAAYYLHIEPGGRSFLGGGKWHPDSSELRLLRRSIDRHARSFKDALSDPDFIKLFGGIDGLFKTEDKLKRAPKDYPIDHPEIDLLKLKSFTVGAKLDDDAIFMGSGIVDIIAHMFTVLHPLITKLNSIVAPDIGSDYNSDTD